jgi:ABC-2 type transport system ATP-binding protein
MSMPSLQVENLVKCYPRFALKEISFELPRGYIMGLIGPNGAGKSTTVKGIMNLVRLDGGTVRVCGLDHRTDEEWVKQLVGYVGGEQYFYSEMSVHWTAAFVRRYYRSWDEHYFGLLMEKYELDHRKKIKELSRGMKVKLALILALAHRPRLLILDEPTSGLDPIVRHELLKEMLEMIQDEDCSILFSSHITDDIHKVADFITIINDGAILESAPKEDIFNRYRRVVLPVETARALDRNCFVAWKETAPCVVAVTTDYPRLRERLDPDLPGETLNLDQILLSLVKGEV